MQYALLFFESESAFAKRTDPAQADAYWNAWMAYSQAAGEAGIMVSGTGLQPPETSTTVRLKDSARDVQDGPIADTKEQLGGLFVIESPDLDTALLWAAKAPCAGEGGVEIRPLMPPPPTQ